MIIKGTYYTLLLRTPGDKSVVRLVARRMLYLFFEEQTSEISTTKTNWRGKEKVAFAIMRCAKLKGGAITASDRHTERSMKTPNADAERTENNLRLRGERGDDLKQKIEAVISGAQAKTAQRIRKDGVKCVEFFFGASPEYFEKPLTAEQKKVQDERGVRQRVIDRQKELEFYRKTDEFMEQLEERGFVFVKAVAHRDEQTPHVVAYAVPLDKNKRLNCKAHLGGREKLSALQDEYAEAMKPLGLERGVRGSTAEHQRVKTWYGRVELLDEAVKDRDRMAELFEQATRLLQQERGRLDVELMKMTKTLLPPERLVETRQGVAILSRSNPAEVRALVTPNNKAFDSAGRQISDGSSLRLLEHLAPPETKIEQLTALLAQRFGDETAMSAARNFAGEIVSDLSEPDEAQRRKKANEQSIDIEAVKTEVQARIELQRETQTPRRIENTQTTERGLSR